MAEAYMYRGVLLFKWDQARQREERSRNIEQTQSQTRTRVGIRHHQRQGKDTCSVLWCERKTVQIII